MDEKWTRQPQQWSLFAYTVHAWVPRVIIKNYFREGESLTMAASTSIEEKKIVSYMPGKD